METWDSGLVVVKGKPTIQIPIKILLVCKKIQQHVGENEFSILCKGKWSKGKFIISNDYVVPKQKVSPNSVQYDNKHVAELMGQGYNVVIHSHPFSHDEGGFSTVDDENINSNFECSILYTRKGFTKAIINIHIAEDTKIQLEGKIELVYNEDIEVKGLENIDEYKYSYGYPYITTGKPMSWWFKKQKYNNDEVGEEDDYLSDDFI